MTENYLIDDYENTYELLKKDVIKSLRDSSELGAWVNSAHIGIEVGFDRANAGKNVRPILKELVSEGVVEERRELNKPIIYRWKSWKTELNL